MGLAVQSGVSETHRTAEIGTLRGDPVFVFPTASL